MLLFLLMFLLALMVFPAQATQGAVNAVRLCANAVVPALLPYFILLKLLCERLRLPPLLTSFLGGYPTGVACIVTMYEAGNLDKAEARNLLRVCNNSGPGFFIAVVGGIVLKSTKLGIMLYLIHVSSALMCAQLSVPVRRRDFTIRREKAKRSFAAEFQNAVSSAALSMLNVCTLVIVFSVLFSILRVLLPSRLLLIPSGLLELTNGVLQLREHRHAFVLCALFTGWGGLCVHAQAYSLWQTAGLRVRGYFTHKLLHGLLSAVLAALVQAGAYATLTIFAFFFVIFSYFLKNWGRKKMPNAV